MAGLVPVIHVFLAAMLLRRGCPGHLAKTRFCSGMTNFVIGANSIGSI